MKCSLQCKVQNKVLKKILQNPFPIPIPLQTFWCWVISLVPLWVAPNLITIGLPLLPQSPSSLPYSRSLYKCGHHPRPGLLLPHRYRKVPFHSFRMVRNFHRYRKVSHFQRYRKVRSTVRLRFRKSISRHHFQNTRKFDNNDFQYHRDVIYSVY